MSTPNQITFADSYPTYLQIFIGGGTIYLGMFVMVSNHYILRPRVQQFLTHMLISSVLMKQIIINLISNLPALGLLLSSILLTNNDGGLGTIILADGYWMGIYLLLVLYRNKTQKQNDKQNFILVAKNAILLVINYASISYHYITNFFFVSMGLSLFVSYLFCLLSMVYEERFIKFIDCQGAGKIAYTQIYQHKCQYPSLQYLSAHYPVTNQQMLKQLSKYKSKIDKIKLKTKSYVSQKLLEISLTINISKSKMEADQIKQVKQYYGSMNGTLQRKNSHAVTNKLYSSTQRFYEQNNADEDSNLSHQEIEDASSILLIVFPVKIFQSSKIISIVINIFLNIALGFALDFAINIATTAKYGRYVQFIYAILLLPIIPTVSKVDFFNTMCLSSIWKYGLLGFFLLIWSFNNSMTLTWDANPLLGIQLMSLGVMVIVDLTIIKLQYNGIKLIGVMFMVNLVSNGIITYFIESS